MPTHRTVMRGCVRAHSCTLAHPPSTEHVRPLARERERTPVAGRCARPPTLHSSHVVRRDAAGPPCTLIPCNGYGRRRAQAYGAARENALGCDGPTGHDSMTRSVSPENHSAGERYPSPHSARMKATCPLIVSSAHKQARTRREVLRLDHARTICRPPFNKIRPPSNQSAPDLRVHVQAAASRSSSSSSSSHSQQPRRRRRRQAVG